MVPGNHPVVEAQPNQRHFKVVCRRLRQTFDVSAEFVAEIPHPSAAKNPLREIVSTVCFEFIFIQHPLQFCKGLFLRGVEFEYLFWFSRPVAEPICIYLGLVAA